MDDAQCRRFNSRFQRFSASKHYAQVLEWLAIYLQNAIIAPWRTEYSFWSVSCLPFIGSQAIWRRSYAVNAAVMELFVVGRWSDGADPPWAFINVASDVLEDGFGSLSEVARSHPGLDLSNDRMYHRDAGAHQVTLFMEDACCLPRVLADTAIQTAARTLALRHAEARHDLRQVPLPAIGTCSIGCSPQITKETSTMQFTHEHREIQKTLKRFIDEEINPHVDEWEAAEIFPAHEVFKKMGNLGLLGLCKPEEYGGQGLDYSYSLAMAEALGHIHCGGVPMAIGVQTDMCTPALARYGSDELKRQFLAPRLRATWWAASA